MPRAATVRLALLFGGLYFLQGLVEPGDGLIAQPSRSQLERWGWDAGQIGGAMLLTALPWSFKPIFGLLSDALPVLGSRRRGWLALVSAAAAAALLVLALAPASGSTLVLGLAVATAAVAFADVVVDAHMVETCQPRGITGQIQAVQWAAIYVAAALAAALGGRLSGAGAERTAYLVAAIASAVMLAVTLAAVRDQADGTCPEGPVPKDSGRAGLRAALRELAAATRDPGLRAAAGFLALWGFTPGYGAVHDYHLTRGLGLPEALYGDAAAVHAVACAGAAALYGLYCRRLPFVALLHASIALGIVSAAINAAAVDATSLLWASVLGGAAYMTASLAQLDLAARVCPPRIAGSVFALLMAAQNFSLSVACWLGGQVYDVLAPQLGPVRSYAVLAVAGGVFTSGCWLLLPQLRAALARTSRG